MKIKNLSQQDLQIPMKKSNGQKLIVTLRPGQFAYSEAKQKRDNKQLLIWERKKAIEITEDELPKNLEYCHPYSPLTNHTVIPVSVIELVEEGEDEDEDDEVPVEVEISPVAEDDDFEPKIPTTEKKEEEKINKGGRPKGAKNKSKKGRKKVKRGRGRPSKKIKPPIVIDSEAEDKEVNDID